MMSANEQDWPSDVAAGALGAGVAVEREEAPPRVMRFRHFRITTDTRSLFAGSKEVEVGSRVFDLLVVLVANQGRVVSKAELMRRVWPSLTVDESNLRFQMAGLRRVLGGHSDLVRTIPGRGYFFAKDASPEHSQGVDGESPGAAIPSAPMRSSLYDDLVRENLRLRRALYELALSGTARPDLDGHAEAHA